MGGSFKTCIYGILVVVILISCRKDKVFKNYEVEEFTFNGHDAIVVYPKIKGKTDNWIWRARYWGHEPQVDKFLLDNGFHLVYIDVSNLFGNQIAIDLWDDFYTYCRNKYKLNQKVVLEGMSRGGLIVYNWASRNTEKVSCIYVDAPVCDIKSWPAGMYSRKQDNINWEMCKEALKLDEVSVLNYRDLPIFNCVNIAKAGVPILHVYGDSDTIVPPIENTLILEKKVKNANGIIKLIVKEGVGHNHYIKDPTPIFDFILENTIYLN